MQRLKICVPFLALLFLVSCDHWTPPADAYFSIDGKSYHIDLMVVYKQPYDEGPVYFPEIIMQGAPYINATMSVGTSSPTLISNGTYSLAYFTPFAEGNLVGLQLRTGPNFVVENDAQSLGTMTVTGTNNNLTIDFSGSLQGHSVKIHYAGLVAASSY